MHVRRAGLPQQQVLPARQVRNGVVYVAAGSDPAQFGQQLGNALQLVEQLPNPIILIYDYVLHIAGGGQTANSMPASQDLLLEICESSLKALRC
jgi:hypothetical protein